MAQAKGVLPTKGDDREVLYRNPAMHGFFVGIRLTGAASPGDIQAWLPTVDSAIETLVVRGAPTEDVPKGVKQASVAVGLAASFFDKLNVADELVERPVGFNAYIVPDGGWFGSVPLLAVDVLFYVATVDEARALEFVDQIAASSLVESVSLERGHQRRDETEHFGYKDGVRNIAKSDRSRAVFIHTAGDQPDEPAWADGGTYLATMKIVQDRSAFAALPGEAARDQVIGRTKDGTRLDLISQQVKPHDEPANATNGLPATSHVRKAGPRGAHDDTVIFRRGLPYTEVVDGRVQVGLLFASFQANPAQFETVFRDWMLSPHFPPGAPGAPAAGGDALLQASLVQMVHAGMFFVTPHHDGGLAELLAPRRAPARTPQTGRLVVSKRVVNPSDPSQRFERGGFTFHVVDDTGTEVPGSEFTTASSGRGVCPVELEIGRTYTVVETAHPMPVASPANVVITMSKRNEHLRIDNQPAQPTDGYGNRI